MIIIGGGASGIAAATKLNKHGVNLILLEAEQRLGGRVYSVPFGDAKVDLGAEWVHGEKGNIVNEMFKDTGLLHHHPDDKPYKIFPSNRDDVSGEFSRELLNLFLELYDTNDPNATADETINDTFVRRYVKTIKEKYAKDKIKMHIALKALPLFEKYVCSLEASPTWHEPSAISDHVECQGDSFTHWNGKGYFTALEYLMKDFNTTGRVFTDKVVTRIEYDGTKAVVKGNDFKYEAKYVLFTPSLGVLKHDHQDLFEPPLSDQKVQAIKAHGFGAVAKVWMHFAEPWWPKNNFTDITLSWTCEDRMTLAAEYPKGPRKNGQSWLNDFFSVIDEPANPNVLAAWFSGKFIPEIEKMSDEEIMDGVFYALERFVGHLYKLQKPDKILRNNWYSNPHFRGTYSYQTVASRKMQPDAMKIIAEPVKNLHFAGEATNFQHYSTVHGAIETGYREAELLRKALIVKA